MLRISGRALGEVDYSKTQREVSLKNGATLVAGNEYALRQHIGYDHCWRSVFVGKIFELTSCWNGKPGACTYKSSLLFAVQDRDGTWIPRVSTSPAVWGDWTAYDARFEEERKRRFRNLKDNAAMRVVVADAFGRLGLPFQPMVDAYFNTDNYVITKTTNLPMNITIGDILALSARIKAKK